MATLYVTEYATSGYKQIGGVTVQTPDEPPLAEQTVAIGASSAASSAFQTGTTVIRLHVDTVASLAIGLSPVATTSKQRFASGQTEFKSVPKGSGFQVAVIANS